MHLKKIVINYKNRKQHTAVADDKGRVWLWGGVR